QLLPRSSDLARDASDGSWPSESCLDVGRVGGTTHGSRRSCSAGWLTVAGRLGSYGLSFLPGMLIGLSVNMSSTVITCNFGYAPLMLLYIPATAASLCISDVRWRTVTRIPIAA